MGSTFCDRYTTATPVTVWPRQPFPATGGQKLSGAALRDAQDAWNFFELVESTDAATRVRIAQAGGFNPPPIDAGRVSLWYPLNTIKDLMRYQRGQMLHWENCPAINWTSQRYLGFPPAPYDVLPQLCITLSTPPPFADYMYTSGQYTISPTFYNKDNINYLPGSLPVAGNGDMFLTRYTTDGSPVWAAAMQGTGMDNASRIASDSYGNVYVTGYYGSTTLKFLNSDGNDSGISLNKVGGYNIFLVKYDKNGFAQWATRITTAGVSYGKSIIIDNNNSVIISGLYNNNVDIYSTGNVLFASLSNLGSYDICLVKYNTSGTALWCTCIASAGNEGDSHITTDSLNNIYVGGIYYNTTITLYNSNTVNPSLPASSGITLASLGNSSSFTVKYDSSGFAQWGSRLVGATNVEASSITTDIYGNVYTCGNYINNFTVYGSNGASTSVTSSGGFDAFLVKYNSSGITQWATRCAGTNNDVSVKIVTDQSGAVYLYGAYSTSVGVDPQCKIFDKNGTPTFTLPAPNLYSLFLVKYIDGIPIWYTRIISSPGGSNIVPYDATSDISNNIYVTSVFYTSGVTVLNNGGSTAYSVSPSGTTGLVVKYNSSGIAQWYTRYANISSDSSPAICYSSS